MEDNYKKLIEKIRTFVTNENTKGKFLSMNLYNFITQFDIRDIRILDNPRTLYKAVHPDNIGSEIGYQAANQATIHMQKLMGIWKELVALFGDKAKAYNIVLEAKDDINDETIEGWKSIVEFFGVDNGIEHIINTISQPSNKNPRDIFTDSLKPKPPEEDDPKPATREYEEYLKKLYEFTRKDKSTFELEYIDKCNDLFLYKYMWNGNNGKKYSKILYMGYKPSNLFKKDPSLEDFIANEFLSNERIDKIFEKKPKVDMTNMNAYASFMNEKNSEEVIGNGYAGVIEEKDKGYTYELRWFDAIEVYEDQKKKFIKKIGDKGITFKRKNDSTFSLKKVDELSPIFLYEYKSDEDIHEIYLRISPEKIFEYISSENINHDLEYFKNTFFGPEHLNETIKKIGGIPSGFGNGYGGYFDIDEDGKYQINCTARDLAVFMYFRENREEGRGSNYE